MQRKFAHNSDIDFDSAHIRNRCNKTRNIEVYNLLNETISDDDEKIGSDSDL